MKYKGSSTLSQAADRQSQDDRVGVLLVNLGTPDAPTPKALRAYLKEFLGDPRVVEAPRLLWWFALNGVILNIRPRRSARSYAKVFTAEGSPLLFHSRNQALDRKSTRLNSSHVKISYAVFCLKKKRDRSGMA